MASLTFPLIFTLTVLMTFVYGTVNQVPLPTIDLDECWGPNVTTTDSTTNETSTTCLADTTITEYTIEFNDTMISDLRSRLTSHRTFTPSLEGVTFEYGFNSEYLELWVQYLAEDYQFEERATYLNQYSHYKTIIQGMNMHFIRVQSENLTSYDEVVPLLILHGWPGSVREFYETIPYLLSYSEAQGFGIDIIIPSLPGFGFSDGAVRAGMGVDKVAVVCRNLMNRIGYSQYYIQGGDMGALITNNMATFFPDEVLGYHTNYPLLHTPDILFRLAVGSYYPDEIVDSNFASRIYPLTSLFANITAKTGYLHMQATKPDTLGAGLSDSAAGLMAYTLEKITVSLPNQTDYLTAEQLLDNYMIYWSTNCITTSMRLYAETFNKRYINLRINEIRSPVPTWVLQPPSELIYLPGWMIKLKFPNLLSVTSPSTGNHFYAWTHPDYFAEDVINAIVAFKEWHAMNSTLYTSCSSYISY